MKKIILSILFVLFSVPALSQTMSYDEFLDVYYDDSKTALQMFEQRRPYRNVTIESSGQVEDIWFRESRNEIVVILEVEDWTRPLVKCYVQHGSYTEFFQYNKGDILIFTGKLNSANGIMIFLDDCKVRRE